MRTRGGTEIRGAEGFEPGPYWAVFCWSAKEPGGWLELLRERPRFEGRVAVRHRDRVQLADGRPALVWCVVTIQRNGKVRYAWPRERRAVGDLLVVVP